MPQGCVCVCMCVCVCEREREREREIITFTIGVHITFILATIIYKLDEVTVSNINEGIKLIKKQPKRL